MASGFENEQKGQKALKAYFDESQRFANFPFHDFAAFIYQFKSANQKNIELLGQDIDVSEGQAANIMRNLADKNAGVMPAKFSEFMRPFANPESILSASTWNDLSAIASAVPSAVGETAQSVAIGVTTSLKIGSYLVPVAIALAIGFLIFQKGGGSLKGLSK
jgi:NDP-sugar pyrophosphorylase family protein